MGGLGAVQLNVAVAVVLIGPWWIPLAAVLPWRQLLFISSNSVDIIIYCDYYTAQIKLWSDNEAAIFMGDGETQGRGSW